MSSHNLKVVEVSAHPAGRGGCTVSCLPAPHDPPPHLTVHHRPSTASSLCHPTRCCFRRKPRTPPSLATVHPIIPCLWAQLLCSVLLLITEAITEPLCLHLVPDLPLCGTQTFPVGDPDLQLWGTQTSCCGETAPPPTASSPYSIKGTLFSLSTSASPPGLIFLWATDSFPLHLNLLPSPRHLFSTATPLPTSPACIHIRSEHLVHLLLGFLTLCLLSACGS